MTPTRLEKKVEKVSSGLAPIGEVQLLGDKAFEALRNAILDMSFAPDDSLVEAKLAEDLGTSKTPIRQALRRLEQIGLVTVTPYKGYSVSELTLHDAREILELRAVLEGYAVYLGNENLQDNDFHKLSKLLQQAHDSFEDGDLGECAELGHRFHRYILEHADNSRLSQMIESLNDQFHRVRLLSVRIPGRLPLSMDEHLKIFTALRAGDGKLAEALMREHLRLVYESLEDDEVLIG